MAKLARCRPRRTGNGEYKTAIQEKRWRRARRRQDRRARL